MFCYQRKFYSEVEVINTVEEFDRIINDDELKKQAAAEKQAAELARKKAAKKADKEA